MNTDSKKGFWVLLIVIVLVIVAGIAIYATSQNSQPSVAQQTSPVTQNIQAVFTCDGGKSVNATFMNESNSTTTGNSVLLSLSDGRQMTLPQAISADGARYANADESVVFWNKGNGAFIQENGTTTFDNCLTQTQ